MAHQAALSARALLIIALLVTLGAGARCAAAADQPNVIVIMVDDMGYSDIGSFGGEINTPNIDSLAATGVRYTQFYNTGRCSPTRAALLTGQYSHNVGMGQLPSTNYNNQNGGTMPGYSGWFAGSDPQAPDVAPTLPETLSAAGYRTSMSGKWHLTRTNTINDGPNGTWPTDRGFDRFYGTMEGAKDYFEPTWLVDSDTSAVFEDSSSLPSDYFYTQAITEHGAQYIRDAATDNDEKPFFHYHAFYAPHFPLQAPADATDESGANLVQKYQALYAQGWDQLRQDRFDRQMAMGLWAPGTTLSDKLTSNSDIADWNTLSSAERDELILRMAVYAAQVEIMDQAVGDLLDAVDDPNGDGDTSDSIRDETTILFISDNGAVGGSWDGTGDPSNWDNAASAIDVKYGAGWANMSNTPFREFKGDAYEGGISSPLIVSGYGVDASLAGSVDRETVSHVVDIFPTVTSLGKASYPGNADATEIEGRSLTGSLAGHAAPDREVFFEHEGNRAARVGDWKIVGENGSGEYALYNLENDRNELNNLATEMPDLQRLLRQKWEAWAERNQAANSELDNAGAPFLTHEEINWVGQKRSTGALMLHLDFEDGAYASARNTQVTDQSGNGFHGSLLSDDAVEHSVASGLAGLGDAIDLDHDIVDVDLRSDIGLGAQARSISVWFNADGIGNKRVFGYGHPDGSFAPGSLMLLTMDGDDPADAVMKLRLGTTNLDFDPGDSNAIGVNQWVHAIVVVPTDAASSADIKMFINGAEVASELEAGDQHVPLVTGMSWLTIGRRGGAGPGGSQGTTYDFDGRVADLQVYGRGLTPDEAAYLFANPGQTLLNTPGDFNGDGSVTAEDYEVWRASYGSLLDLSADANGDGLVDSADYSVWRNNLGATSIPGASLAANNVVPEPGSLSQIAFVAACLLTGARSLPLP